MDIINLFRPKKITARIIFSYCLFLVFMSLDFLTTEFNAQGNVGMEGNIILTWWWNIFGQFRHIDIPIWIIYIFFIAYFLNTRSEFLALWWLNGIAFGHLIGWITWSPYYRILDFLYGIASRDWLETIVLSSFGMLLGILLAFVKIKFVKKISWKF